MQKSYPLSSDIFEKAFRYFFTMMCISLLYVCSSVVPVLTLTEFSLYVYTFEPTRHDHRVSITSESVSAEILNMANMLLS